MSNYADWDEIYEAATEKFCDEFFEEFGRDPTDEEVDDATTKRGFIEDFMSSLADAYSEY